jgi:hypothetical protein
MSIQSLNPQGFRSSPTWQERLAGCHTEGEVLESARDFLAQFSPCEIAQLPEACRPPRLKDANDISEYAFTLVRHHCDNGVPPDYAVHRLVVFFSNATVRLSKILHLQSASGNDGERKESA